MTFNYYYGSEADQFSFIRIPKALLTDETFYGLSLQSKMLYGILLDRMGLSMKNGWLDSENRVYIIYQITEIQKDLNLSKKKAIDCLNELETFGLVEKKRRGLGLPSILYVKSFLVQKDNSKSDFDGENEISRSVDFDTSRSVDFYTSRSVDFDTSRSAVFTPQEVPDLAPLNNNTKYNDTKYNKSNLILSSESINQSNQIGSDEMGEEEIYEMIIKNNISYDSLLQAHPTDKDIIEGIVSLILDCILSKNETMIIASNCCSSKHIKSKFMQLNYYHIEYVLECLKNNTTKIKNIKKYLLVTLFNAPATIDSYYRAEVNHDMPYMAKAR